MPTLQIKQMIFAKFTTKQLPIAPGNCSLSFWADIYSTMLKISL